MKPNEQSVSILQSPLSPVSVSCPYKKEKEILLGYLRLRRTRAAATAMITMVAKPIAMYVVVAVPLAGHDQHDLPHLTSSNF